ncbi:hypothetical protein L7F22_046117 [Adiantum nelumboides]|nr:hypothetical protein [Adiantum nelumboides]
MATIRAVIAVAVAKGWILHQMDVKVSFLHGNLQEEAYMEQKLGFQDKCHLDYVYEDHSLNVQKIDAEIVIINILVDDLIIGSDALKDVEHVKALMRKQFDMKDLGELRYFLGIEMILNEGAKLLQAPIISNPWFLQKNYGLDMLMKFGMADFKPIFAPLDQNLKLSWTGESIFGASKEATFGCRETYNEGVLRSKIRGTILAYGVFEKWGIDATDPLPITARGFEDCQAKASAKVKDKGIKKGNMVLCYNSNLDSTFQKKFQIKWQGTFLVLDRFPNGTYQLAALNGTPHKARINGYRLKKYYARLMVVIEDKPSFEESADMVADHEEKMKTSSFGLYALFTTKTDDE